MQKNTEKSFDTTTLVLLFVATLLTVAIVGLFVVDMHQIKNTSTQPGTTVMAESTETGTEMEIEVKTEEEAELEPYTAISDIEPNQKIPRKEIVVTYTDEEATRALAGFLCRDMQATWGVPDNINVMYADCDIWYVGVTGIAVYYDADLLVEKVTIMQPVFNSVF